MNNREMKLRIIEEIMEIEDQDTIITWYELITNHDIDYIPNLFASKEEFEAFIEEWKTCKCSEGEE